MTLVPAAEPGPPSEKEAKGGKRKSKGGDAPAAGGSSGVGVAGRLVAHSGHARKIFGGVNDDDETPSPASRFRIGQTIEVLQEDEGFEGSYYAAELLEVAEEKASVRAMGAAKGGRHPPTLPVVTRGEPPPDTWPPLPSLPFRSW